MKMLVQLFVIALLFSSCATIVGGSRYTAYVSIDKHPNAQINYNGLNIGTGSAVMQIKRRDADKVGFEISQEGCSTQKHDFSVRKFRGWSFAGSLASAFFFPVVVAVPIPVWNVLDVATGAVYKPDAADQRIIKGDYKSYYYNLTYNCDVQPTLQKLEQDLPYNTPAPVKLVVSKKQKLIELKELFDGGMITEEEYKTSRQAILNQ